MTTIKLGSRGAEVRNLQKRLNCQVTGVCSTPTLRAVVAFQEANNVLATGEVDDHTYDLLFPAPKSFVRVELESIKELVTPQPDIQAQEKPKQTNESKSK